MHGVEELIEGGELAFESGEHQDGDTDLRAVEHGLPKVVVDINLG